MATAIPKACLASSAIRCCDVETGVPTENLVPPLCTLGILRWHRRGFRCYWRWKSGASAINCCYHALISF